MALETGTYLADLVPSNPAPSDGLGQADDHMRLIKSALKNTFAGFTSAALSSSQAQLDAAVAAVAGIGTSLRFPLGTVALPGVTPFGDTDTGIYSPAANQLALATQGAVALSIDAAQNTTVKQLTSIGGIAATAVVNTGAYSGGTGQLVPIGATLIYWDDTLPVEGGYCWANGGTLSRTGNPLLWARWGTKYGAGDGSTTFNVPNLCETVPVGQRAMAGASSRALLATGVLGVPAFGAATNTLVTGNLPPYTPAGAVAVTSSNGSDVAHAPTGYVATNFYTGGGGTVYYLNGGSAPQSGINLSGSFTGTAQGGLSTPLNNVQPTTVCNFIIRIG